MMVLKLLALGCISALIVLCILVFFLRKGALDPLSKFEPITDDELLLLSIIDESFYEDMLVYARTMKMSIELEDYLSDKKDILETLSYYMMLQFAKIEKEKKEQFESSAQGQHVEKKQLSHNEKLILQRIKMFDNES